MHFLNGCLVPVVTPFTDSGEIDYFTYEYLIDLLIRQGVGGIVCFGTTGEVSTLSFEEKQQLLSRAIRISEKRVPIIANTGTNSTQTSVEFTLFAQSVGADAVLVITPYYNCPSQEGCKAHFFAISKCKIPWILYHIPKRTGVTLNFETIAEILSFPQAIGIKECSQNLDLFTQIKERFPEKWLFSGSDLMIIEEFKRGADGSIGAIGNVIPSQWKTLCMLAKQDINQALQLFNSLQGFIEAVYQEVNPSGVKFSLSEAGLCKNILRLPLLPVGAQTQVAIRDSMAQVFELAL